MAITKSDVVGLLIFAIRQTAEKVGISDIDWKAPKELLEEIQSVDEETYNLLDKFIKAYYACFKNWTHKNITRRNEARTALLTRLDQIIPRIGT
jgi:hypothetical protein